MTDDRVLLTSYTVAMRPETKPPPHRLSVAPMMDWTDRHCRYFHRLLSRRALLYTEMVTAEAILHGDRRRLLGCSQIEQPVALQLGGSEPGRLAAAAEIGAAHGYGEINLNVGCPSDRVHRGRFGACLMAEPDLVADCVAAMRRTVTIPVTVKCRVGIDDLDSDAHLRRFVEAVAGAGCGRVIVHARKAWLKGLSPKENRETPPLDRARVHRLKERFPELEIIVNGGIDTLAMARAELVLVDGVMLGRAAYHDPYLLAGVDREIFAEPGQAPGRDEVAREMIAYAREQIACGCRLHHITRHMLGLYRGRPGARAFRRHLSEWANRDGAGADVIEEAIEAMHRPDRSLGDPADAESSTNRVLANVR